MDKPGHRFTYTEDPHSGQVRTLTVDGVRWLPPLEAALQAQATRADERERLRAQVEALLGVSPSSYWDDAVDTVLALLGGESDG